LLGQQVRCPHCQQVVIAPAPEAAAPVAPPPAPEPEPAPFTFAKEDDSIFGPKQPHDDLFGEPEPPTLELPPEPPAANGLLPTPPAPQPAANDATWDLAPAAPPPGRAFTAAASEPAVLRPAADDPNERTGVGPPEPEWLGSAPTDTRS